MREPEGGDLASGGRRVDWRTGALFGLAVALNGGVILLLSLPDQRPTRARPGSVPLLYLDIEPQSVFTTNRSSVSAAHRSTPVAPANRAPDAARNGHEGVSPPSAASPAKGDAPSDIPAINPAWRVTANGGDGRMPAALRQAVLDCDATERLTTAQRRRCDPSPIANPHLPQPLGAALEARFATQAAWKKMWRDYYEGDGAYPGLRSLREPQP